MGCQENKLRQSIESGATLVAYSVNWLREKAGRLAGQANVLTGIGFMLLETQSNDGILGIAGAHAGQDRPDDFLGFNR